MHQRQYLFTIKEFSRYLPTNDQLQKQGKIHVDMFPHTAKWVKMIIDMFPNIFEVESVVLLSKLNTKKHINIELDTDKLDLTSSESKATYQEIKVSAK